MWVSSSAASDVGQVRKNNEDAFHVDDSLGIYVVCDGVGGHSDGEVASAEATKTITRYLTERKAEIDAFVDTSTGRDAMRRLVRDAVRI